jgi:hypothetical protein
LRWRWVLGGALVALAGAYAFHPYQGIPQVGPLYWSEALPELAILAAGVLSLLTASLGRSFGRITWIVIVASSALLLQRHFVGMRVEARRRIEAFAPVRAAKIDRGIVFVHYEGDAAARRFPILPPDPDDRPIYAFDLGRRNVELMRELHETKSWIFNPETGRLRRFR